MSQFDRKSAVVLTHFMNDEFIVASIGNDGDALKILGGRPDHCRSTDINLFDSDFRNDVYALNCFLKGIKIHDDHVDGFDAMFAHCRDVFIVVS